jgi:crotonobetainyl-CoA:carnitine CoA-transferase CaiB-like acyl-CoA transferase
MTAALLEPVRVLDLTSGPLSYCGRVLADLGAYVVLVEPPGGSPARRAAGGELDAAFAFTAAGKKSVTLDVREPGGAAVFLRLADRADAVISMAAPGELDRHGLGHQALLARNPALVFGSITPYGLYGPRRGWRGSDLTAWAASGTMPGYGDPDRAPLTPREGLALAAGALNAAMGIVLALAAREQSGCGQLVDISLQEAALSVAQDFSPALALDTGSPPQRYGKRRRSPPMGQYRTRDGAVMIVAFTPWQWRALADWISAESGLSEVLSERYAGTPGDRSPYVDELDGWIEDLTLRYGKQEFAEEAQRRGIPVCPVNSVPDLLSDPHLAATDSWLSVPSPGGTVRMPAPALAVDGARLAVGPVPAAGADNAGILAGELGVTDTGLLRPQRPGTG